MGVLAFLAAGLVAAILCHRWVRPFWLAVLVAGPAAAALFQLVVTVQLGHVDPFFPIALFTTTLLGWMIAIAVGLGDARPRSQPADLRQQFT
jgi:hypothetical protein